MFVGAPPSGRGEIWLLTLTLGGWACAALFRLGLFDF
jgi:hypothetical protein